MHDELNRRHLAAVMFTDMAGYTALMHKDEAAALRSRARHRSALERSVSDRRGKVLQYFGDGSLSYFESSVEAVEAAIEIQRELAGDPTLRVGLHMGDIAYDVQGAYGDAVNIAAKLEALCPPGGVMISQKIYDDIRRHPNLAVVPGGVVRLKHIDQSVSTYLLAVEGLAVPSKDGAGLTDVASPHESREKDSQLPKPLLDRLHAGPRSGQDPLAGVATVPGKVPFVGRRHEVDELRASLERAEHGQASAIFLRGPRGVGKTRLAQEVAEFARARDWIVLSGRAHPSERLVPYAPFSDALLPLLRGLDLATLAGLTPGDDAALCRLFPALGPAPKGPDIGPAAPGEARVRLFWQFATMLSRLAAYRPVLLVLEDLDFADRASLELLEFVARQSRSERMVFMVEYTGANAERKQALLGLEQSLISDGIGRVLELDALDESEAVEFIRHSFDLEETHVRELARTVYSWSRGNPFFMIGTLRGLVESGALRNEDGRWSPVDLRSVEVPRSVRDAILVWMSQLTDAALGVARTVAVLGRQVSYEVVRHVVDLSDADLGRALDELVRHQLLQESESQWTLMYAFRNPLIREALRNELPLPARRELHTHLAHALETYYGDRADDHANELAYHYGRAHPGRAGSKAVRYLQIAGDAALRRQANREAADYLQEALDRLEAAPPSAALDRVEQSAPREKILKSLARARRRLGDASGSIALWRRLLGIAQSTGDSSAIAALHREIGLTHMAGGEFEEAIEYLGAAAEWAGGAASIPLIVRAQLAAAACYQQIGQPNEAERVVDHSLLLAKELGHPGLLGQVYRARIQHNFWTGRIDQARDAAKQALELSRQSGDRGVEFWSRWAMGAMEGLTGNTVEMESHVRAARELAEAVGAPFFALATHELSIELAYARGEWDEALETGRRALELAHSTDERLVRPRLLVWVSLIHLARGELERADELTQEAWEVANAAAADPYASFVDLHAVVPAHIGRASYELARGNWAEAVRIAEAGLAIADRSGYIVWAIHHILPIIAEASIHARDLEHASEIGKRMRREAERLGHPLGMAWADACDGVLTWLQEDAAAGARSLLRGAESLESIPLTFDAARLRRQRAGRLAEVGDVAGAAEELRRVHAIFLRLGATPELEKTRGQFGEIGVEPPPLPTP